MIGHKLLQFVQGMKNMLKNELDEIYNECSGENWDGFGANPVKNETYKEARNFISLIPLKYMSPKIIPEPNGDIAFEWFVDSNNVLVISFEGKNTITYVCALNGQVISDVLEFNDIFPSIITSYFDYIF